MKGDLYAQGKSSHELQEVIDYMGKAHPALFFFFFFNVQHFHQTL